MADKNWHAFTVGTLLSLAVSAQAGLTIDFESSNVDEGLNGQTGTSQPNSATWYDAGIFDVKANAGNGGGKAIVSRNVGTTTSSSTPSATYDIKGALVGATFNATQNIHYSLDLKLVAPTTTSTTELYRIYLPLAPDTSNIYAIYFSIRADGSLKVANSSGGTTTWNDVFDDTSYHTISGNIHYGTGGITVVIDGNTATQFTGAFNTTNIAGNFSDYGTIKINRRQSQDTAANQLSVDNIIFDLAAIPEPMSVAVLGLGALTLLGRKSTLRI